MYAVRSALRSGKLIAFDCSRRSLLGGVGSGGRRVGAGRLRVPVHGFCAWCRRPTLFFRKTGRYCELHDKPARRTGPVLEAIARQAVNEATRLERQFRDVALVHDVVRRARVELEDVQRAIDGAAEPFGRFE